MASVVGFLIGLAGSSALGYYFLMGDQQQADRRLAKDLQRVTEATQQVLDYAQQIDGLKRQLQQVQVTSATKDDLDRVRSEIVSAQVRRHRGIAAGCDQRTLSENGGNHMGRRRPAFS